MKWYVQRTKRRSLKKFKKMLHDLCNNNKLRWRTKEEKNMYVYSWVWGDFSAPRYRACKWKSKRDLVAVCRVLCAVVVWSLTPRLRVSVRVLVCLCACTCACVRVFVRVLACVCWWAFDCVRALVCLCLRTCVCACLCTRAYPVHWCTSELIISAVVISSNPSPTKNLSNQKKKN